jgi:hypothetical protein
VNITSPNPFVNTFPQTTVVSNPQVPTIMNGQPNLFTMPMPPNIGFNTSYDKASMHQNHSNNYNVQPMNNYNVQPQITNDYNTPQSINQHRNSHSGVQKDFKQSSGDHWRGFIS